MPIALILSYMGCSDSALGKYIQLYSELGLSSLATTAPTTFLFAAGLTSNVRKTGYGHLALDLIEVLSSNDVKDDCSSNTSNNASSSSDIDSHSDSERRRDILVHVLSNNGVFLLEALLQQAPSNFVKRIKGIVFDSAPVLMTRQGVIIHIHKQLSILYLHKLAHTFTH